LSIPYFGAIDNFASKGKPKKRPAKNKTQLKFIFLFLVIFAALLLRIVKVDVKIAIALAALFGIIGIAIIILLSAKRNTMVHCTVYCPIGTIVNYFRFINPFRMYIDKSCTKCMRCTQYCNYDALKPENIKKGKPEITCTLCGDCVNSCSLSSIRYKLFGLNPETARTTWLILTISIHATFLALARI
jgi:ferredoxin-type protein NapH